MEYKIVFYALIFLLPAVMLVILPGRSVLAQSVIFWGIVLTVLLYDVQSMGWIVVVLWMAFGIPIGILYFSVIRLMISAVKSAYANFARSRYDAE